ncbi:serine hydrolase domain-containing protein [Labrys monachus]|uniref:CubicO group peptidase (Beta-lactamase class C family) n=1 Tax=Labrys monachus TaxID=217067 RepID=A0ABU0FG83_9HYPH|nr:serine hydrolase domain-containing protein [Labrys monachus]MDQ0393619.1 CubicO group peptidase (beta-lactamase class C family) [Labrys monachus]
MTIVDVQAMDSLLREPVDAKEIPGVVAMAADRGGRLYEGAFGVRSLATGVPMSLDTVLWYASMTKALVATGAMQLVEQGRVALDEPIGRIIPALAAPQVLDGFDAAGKPLLRPAKRPITLRHLLTHTSGFGYDIWNASVERYMRENGVPLLVDCKLSSLGQPLAADPGEKWEYGISIDWVGQVVEALSGQSLEAYLTEHLFKPLGMNDTAFIVHPERRARRADVHQRHPDGSLETIDHEISQEPEFFMGGGGLYGTAGDYIAYIRMMLNDGRAPDGTAVLQPETVDLMGRNAIGDIEAGVLRPVLPKLANDTDFFPGMSQKWGLSFLINTADAPNGRSAGSLTWAGLANCYFWIDRTKRLGGVVMTQILPFGDPRVLRLYGAFEQQVYRRLAKAA